MQKSHIAFGRTDDDIFCLFENYAIVDKDLAWVQKSNNILDVAKHDGFYFRWTDVTGVEKSSNLLAPDTIKISTRESDFNFGLFVRRSNEAFELIGQLANLVMDNFLGVYFICFQPYQIFFNIFQ